MRKIVSSSIPGARQARKQDKRQRNQYGLRSCRHGTPSRGFWFHAERPHASVQAQDQLLVSDRSQVTAFIYTCETCMCTRLTWLCQAKASQFFSPMPDANAQAQGAFRGATTRLRQALLTFRRSKPARTLGANGPLLLTKWVFCEVDPGFGTSR